VIFTSALRALRPAVEPVFRFLLGERLWLRLYWSVYTRFKEDAGYRRQYYLEIEESNAHSYLLFAQTLVSAFHPSSVVDVGCGAGGVALAFRQAGCETVHAFDYSRQAIALAKERGLASVRQLDLTSADQIPATGDLCICLEVAEHLPGVYAARLCRLLAGTAPIVAMTAAPPGQGGHLHVNEQPQEYWIHFMESVSMRYDPRAVEEIRRMFGGQMIRDYDQNLMIFRRNG
jgi:SAM-dependent methyltransferase